MRFLTKVTKSLRTMVGIKLGNQALYLGCLIILVVLPGVGTWCQEDMTTAPVTPVTPTPKRAIGVCPPFPLRDEAGMVIDPVKGVNDTVPYSPRQTCGARGCHDYAKITEGYHFTQGKGETMPKEFAGRYNWVLSPGNYGGNWCSPAPLYRQLAPKQNKDASGIDMTSFEFVTATCGNCHPGGGPLEFDREGRRYDTWMSDQASGMVSGGDNSYDGDYYKARWSETGVIEADCLLCHMPEYDLGKRNTEIQKLNFRWAATAGAGFGRIKGNVQAGEQPTVLYDATKFDGEGNVRVHMAPEPRNEACLGCHLKPGWKKRGAAYTARSDVHAAAGMRCTDCHESGSRASDLRIRGREVHQIAKGDDPSGWVRNDLDNTVRSCESCHLKGWKNAPRARHAWLPPLHLEKLACQTCHIPYRGVKSALVQASDIYNPAPRVTPLTKQIWTFYDQDMVFWNHYGELDLFTGPDAPTNVTRPTLFRYKGKVYPGNRVHSAWVGFEEAGKPGLNQLFMRDFFRMWTEHRNDPKGNYPELALITDDNQDGVIEVNRAEEIDALLAATKAYLAAASFPMEGRRLVWVSDSRAYYSSREWRELARREHEATAYASVYKFSHDVSPARAALGSGGCTDCHRSGSPFFQGLVLEVPFFGDDARPKWAPNHEILNISAFEVWVGAFREERIKPTLYGLAAVLVVLSVMIWLRWLSVRQGVLTPSAAKLTAWVAVSVCVVLGMVAAVQEGLIEYMTAERSVLDANHFLFTMSVLVGAIIVFLMETGPQRTGVRVPHIIGCMFGTLVVMASVAGILMLTHAAWFPGMAAVVHTVFDLSVAFIALAAIILQASILTRMPGVAEDGT